MRAGGRLGHGSVGRLVAHGSHVVVVSVSGLPAHGPLAAAARLDWRSTDAVAGTTLTSRVVSALLRGDASLQLEAEESLVGSAGTLRVRVTCRDGRARRVRLEALAPTGLRVLAPVEVEVAAHGPTHALLTFARGSAPRGARLDVALLAHGPGVAAAAQARVALATVLGRLPRLRPLALVVALALFGAAARAEWPSSRAPA